MQIKVNSDQLRVGARFLLSALIATASYACSEGGEPADAKSSNSKGKKSSDGENTKKDSNDESPSKTKSEDEPSKSEGKKPSKDKSEKTPEESESTGSGEEDSDSSTEGGDSSGADDSSTGDDSTDEPGGDTGDCEVTAQWGSGKPFAAGTAIPNWKIETVFDQNGDGEIKGDELTPKKTDMAGVFCANPRNKFAVITFSSPT